MKTKNLRSFTLSPFSNEWGVQNLRRVIVGYTVLRDGIGLNMSPLTAKFNMRENYLSIRSRGSMILEFIPREESLYDPPKQTMLYREKKTFSMVPEHIHEFINLKSGSLEFQRDSEEGNKLLKISQTENLWEFKLQIGTSYSKQIKLKQSEMFYAQKLCEYSIPYLMGWYALGDARLAEQSLMQDPEPKDPFDSI